MSKSIKKGVADPKLGKPDTLQAVVLADDFTTSLSPAHKLFPSVMTPVVNVPLLDYLVETFVQSRVQELFLYCSSHIDALREYMAGRRYNNIVVSLVISDGCRSLGDALRDLDTKGLIRGDFILARGDAFTNANLQNLMATHRTKHERDKGAALTLVFRNLGSASDSLLREQSCVFVADKSSRKVLFHKKLVKEDNRVKLELEWFLNHDQIEIHSGFVDSHIYLCSPSVLPLFADNFDFQTMEDFVRGVLMNEEILDSRIYWQPLNPQEYALPITSWQAYDTLSRDILQRRGYPLTPDMLPAQRNVVYVSRSMYKHRTAVLARGCMLQGDTFVGAGSILGKDSLVTGSVIGDGARIGDNVRIENSYVHANVDVRDNCVIRDCVSFNNCTLDKSCRLEACVLSSGVSLPAKSHHEDSVIETNGKKISATKMPDYKTDSGEEFLYFKAKENEKSEENCESEESSSETSSRRASPLPDDTNMFLSEVIDSLLRGYQDQLNCDNLILEINSSRYAYNVSIREVTYNVVKAILVLPLHYLPEQKTTVDKANYQKILKVMITYFNPIIAKYVKTEVAQEDCLRAIQDVASTTHELLSFVRLLLHLLYDRDVLSEEKIMEWYENFVEDDTSTETFRLVVEPFIVWLREAEEVSSTDEDDDHE